MIITKSNTVTIIYVPAYYGGCHTGASIGPAAVRATNLNKLLELQGITVKNEFEVKVPEIPQNYEINPKLRYLDLILDYCTQVAHLTNKALEDNSFPIIIGGDHSYSIGSIAGVSNYFKNKNQQLGLLWFDAHGDMNTQETTQSGNIHGMPLSFSLGMGDNPLTNLMGFRPKVKPENAVLIGIRDVDDQEKSNIKASEIQAYTMSDIEDLGIKKILQLSTDLLNNSTDGIHVSFDLDAIDPAFAPGVSTPCDGGLNFREAQHIMSHLAQYAKIRSLDIAEFNPLRDIQNKTGELLCNLILTCLGKNML